jgi:Spy/CpxP family protein refolding chaperone
MRRTILTLPLALLLGINLSALGTLLYYRWGTAANATEPTAYVRHGFLQGELGLTERQLAQTEALRQAFAEKMAPLRRQLQDQNAELVRLLTADPSDTAQVNALLDEIAALQRQLQALAVDHLRQQAKLLQPEQRAKFFQVMEEGMCSRGGRSGCGRGRGAMGGGRCAD